MKITEYKIPVTLTRQGEEVVMEIHEDKQVIHREEEKGEQSHMIMSISKELGDFNEKAIRAAKASLMGKEQKRETFIIRKILG